MKKTIALLLVLALFASLAACGSNDGSTEATTIESTIAAVVTTETVPTTEATVEPTAVTAENTEPAVDYGGVAIMIEASGVKWDYWNVDVIGDAFFITFAYNGMSEAVELFKDAGYDENYSEWVSVKETMQSLFQSNVDLMKTLGVENPNCFLSLVNENNHGETFVTIYNGEITYDIMESN